MNDQKPMSLLGWKAESALNVAVLGGNRLLVAAKRDVHLTVEMLLLTAP
jgi:hypothetical protein